jgi:hypothetical protein
MDKGWLVILIGVVLVGFIITWLVYFIKDLGLSKIKKQEKIIKYAKKSAYDILGYNGNLLVTRYQNETQIQNIISILQLADDRESNLLKDNLYNFLVVKKKEEEELSNKCKNMSLSELEELRDQYDPSSAEVDIIDRFINSKEDEEDIRRPNMAEQEQEDKQVKVFMEHGCTEGIVMEVRNSGEKYKCKACGQELTAPDAKKSPTYIYRGK